MLWPALYSLRYLGFAVLHPFIIHGVRRGLRGQALEAQHAYLESMEEQYVAFLRRLEQQPLVRFNSVSDFDADGQLKPGAPVYSPFVQHSPMLW